jgi:hypothetical protein
VSYQNLAKQAFLCLLTLLSFYSCSSFADPDKPGAGMARFPFPPPVFLEGFGGNNWTLGIDGLIPLIGNHQNLLYTELAGKTDLDSDDRNGSASLGLGLRHITDNSQLLGAYLFVDRNDAARRSHYSFINSGLEWMTAKWRVTGNFYYPLTAKMDVQGPYVGSSVITGHSQITTLYNAYEIIGPGGDASLGYKVPVFNELDVSIGGYYFDMTNADAMTGINVQMSYPLNDRLSLGLIYSYDNYARNRVELGFRVQLFDNPNTRLKPRSVIHDRLVELTRRGLATPTTGLAQPLIRKKFNVGFSVQNNPKFSS